jgi:hypothetical protein
MRDLVLASLLLNLIEVRAQTSKCRLLLFLRCTEGLQCLVALHPQIVEILKGMTARIGQKFNQV